METVARLRELLAEATPGPLEHREHDGQHAICGASLWVGEPEGMPATVGDMARVAADFALHVAAVNALPSLLDRLEAAEVVVEAAGEVNNAAVLMCHATDGDPGCMAERVSLDAAADALRAALRRYTEVPRG